MKVVAVTACPVGIAHTYMAAENLQKAADKLGVEIKVETQGSVGAENVLTAEDIKQADGVIFAADKSIEKERFVGKPLVEAGVQDGIHRAEELIQQLRDGKGETAKAGKTVESNGKQEKKQNPVYKHLMNGVSFMIPFIVVGGLLMAISLSLGGVPSEEGLVVPDDSIWKTVENIGGAAFSFMVPILAGFIAMSIADRPGLAPGMVGGFIAANGSFYGSEADAGFIGGIIAGFLAGYVALGIKKLKVPKAIQPVMPIIIIPVLASLVVGLSFAFLIGEPVAALFEALTVWLEGMQGTSTIVLALILGGMISFDMGGPVNKVAFLFGSAMITEGNFAIMGAIAVAIAVPPIGLGLATFLNKNKYEQAEIEAGKASFTMGLFGITEGAIPFAAKDPLRVIPSIMVGSMTGAVIAMLGGVGGRVAHGGPIVGVLGAIDQLLIFFIAIAVGAIVAALVVNFIKKDISRGAVPVADGAGNTAVEAEPEATVASVEQKTAQDESFNKLTDLVTMDLIAPSLQGVKRDDVIDELLLHLREQHVIDSEASFKEVILAREAQSTTGLGMNVAIPHGKSGSVRKPAVAFGVHRDGVDWHSLDGTSAKLIFMIAVPEERAGDDHLKILQLLSRKLMDDTFREHLLQAETKEELYQLLDQIE
ncbi:fructose-specific PTS transporter subunit EIIC [Shouchella shacheensis]|uniref:fructose-specific PTS transporter subunit EIIC n=1 Tax=Shouchella shacheensis TaxID=1649580 RepID=UPI00073FF36A|nr:fructose-specific PTS transporter subunit EIIC [Shouchella shacheensis]